MAVGVVARETDCAAERAFDVERTGALTDTKDHSHNAGDLHDVLDQVHRPECLALVTAYLEQQISSFDSNSSPAKVWSSSLRRSPFHNKCQPKISLSDYIHRLAKFTNASSLCFVMACSYIDRLCKKDDLYRVSHETAHRLLLCGVLLAAKLTDDKFRSNSYFSKVGGVSMAMLNVMEVEMFMKLDFSLHVPEAQIQQQLLLMTKAVKIESVSIATDENNRRARKRISDDVGFGSEDDIPAKVLHGDQQETVVTFDKDAIVAKDLQDIKKALSKVSKDVSDSHVASRASSVSSCAQELSISERLGDLKTPTGPAVP